MSRGAPITQAEMAFLEKANKTPPGPIGIGDDTLTPMPPPPASLTGAPDSTEHELATMISAGLKQEDCVRAFEGSHEIWSHVAGLSAQQRAALLDPAFPLRLQLHRSHLAQLAANLNPVAKTPDTAAPHEHVSPLSDGAAAQHVPAAAPPQPFSRTSSRPPVAMEYVPRTTFLDEDMTAAGQQSARTTPPPSCVSGAIRPAKSTTPDAPTVELTSCTARPPGLQRNATVSTRASRCRPLQASLLAWLGTYLLRRNRGAPLRSRNLKIRPAPDRFVPQPPHHLIRVAPLHSLPRPSPARKRHPQAICPGALISTHPRGTNLRRPLPPAGVARSSLRYRVLPSASERTRSLLWRDGLPTKVSASASPADTLRPTGAWTCKHSTSQAPATWVHVALLTSCKCWLTLTRGSRCWQSKPATSRCRRHSTSCRC